MSIQSAFDGLNPILQHKIRLGACVLLSKESSLTFPQLKEALGATDGNLGAQISKLESEGFLKVSKSFVSRKPVTSCRLTAAGARALNAHLDAMEAIIGDR